MVPVVLDVLVGGAPLFKRPVFASSRGSCAFRALSNLLTTTAAVALCCCASSLLSLLGLPPTLSHFIGAFLGSAFCKARAASKRPFCVLALALVFTLFSMRAWPLLRITPLTHVLYALDVAAGCAAGWWTSTAGATAAAK
jgi:hypothetical protein